MERSCDVLIIGGGVSGFAAANALAAKGINSILIERSAKAGEVDRGDVLHEASLDLFRKWGLEKEFEGRGPFRFSLFSIYNNSSEEIFRFDLQKDLDRPGWFTVLKHSRINRFLEEAAVRSGFCGVVRGEKVVELITKAERICGVRTASGKQFFAPLTIVATGSRSSISSRYFQPVHYHKYHFSFLNCSFRQLPGFGHAGFYAVGRKGILILVPLPNGEMRIGVQIPPGINLSVESIRELVAERMPSIPVEQLEMIDSHLYPLSRSLSNKWWIPGAVLLGDAAHTVHPAGGQGMNLGFGDADAIADLLSGQPLDNEKLMDSLCEQYSAKRIKEVRPVLRRTHLMGMMGESCNAMLIYARELLIRSSYYFKPFKRRVFKRITNVN